MKLTQQTGCIHTLIQIVRWLEHEIETVSQIIYDRLELFTI